MKILTFLLMLLIASPAVAQTMGDRAPDVGVRQQAIPSFGGPMMWVSPDLFLLGRPADVAENSALWFWSRPKGIFEVKLPDNARPEQNTLCAKDGALQWLEPVRTGVLDPPVRRTIHKLTVDPSTGTASFDNSASAIIGAIQSGSGFPTDSRIEDNTTHIFVPLAGCRLVKLGDIMKAAHDAVQGSGEGWHGQYVNSYGLRVEVGPNTGNFAADWRNRKSLYLDWNFKPITRQQAEASPTTPFGPLLLIDTAKEPAPYAMQLQVSGPDGKPRAILSAPPGHIISTRLSPDGCAVLVTPIEAERPLPDARPSPPSPPPGPFGTWPFGLGGPLRYLPGVMIDICSSESRALVEKPL